MLWKRQESQHTSEQRRGYQVKVTKLRSLLFPEYGMLMGYGSLEGLINHGSYHGYAPAFIPGDRVDHPQLGRASLMMQYCR